MPHGFFYFIFFRKTVTGRSVEICGNLGVNRLFSHDFSNSSVFLEVYRKECNEAHSSSVEKKHSISHPGIVYMTVPMFME